MIVLKIMECQKGYKKAMKMINDEYEFIITEEDINDFLSCLYIAHKDNQLDTVLDIVENENGEYSYYVVLGSSLYPSLQVLFQVDVTACVFKMLGVENQEEWIDLSYSWRKLLLSKYKEEYAKYFVYNWEEISQEYVEAISLIEQYLEEAKNHYEDVLLTYEETMMELENKNNKR